ncbi:IS200/IS605 family transposase [bacterium]|nr:IS200/IS605 family transposase [bacterium]
MANTYTCLHYHIVFSTRQRRGWIRQEIEHRVWEYIGGIARENGMKPLRVGGIEDHVHVVLGAPPTLAVSRIAQLIKGGSSKWIHETFPDLGDFRWQDGYGAFSVSRSSLDQVISYVAGQREHHRELTFQSEFLALLQRHGVEFDERYLWD